MLAGEPSVSGDVDTAVTATAAASREAQNEGFESAAAAAGIFGEDDRSRVLDEADERAFGGNRWPRQETLALLKLRSDMDVAFRDATVKGPLWDEVSRKLGELGYNRSAKKCKEKFENVFKYHKRTKDGRTSKGQGKTYRFFDQLEAFQHHQPSSPQPPVATAAAATAVSLAMPTANNPPIITITVPSTTHITTNPTNLAPPPQPQATNNPSQTKIPSAFHNISTDLLSNSTSSSTSSDLELEGRRKSKRGKWKDFFERLMKEVVDKQEQLQKKFLEAIEKRENERMVREEAWRMQEMARINREKEILAQERSISAAKDAAVMAFLQKVSQQQNPTAAQVILPQLTSAPAPAPAPVPEPAPAPIPIRSQPPPQPQQQPVFIMEAMKTDNGAASSSRWPKVEIEALIKLRTTLDSKYQENGPKGPLWEEISSGMRRLGYNRNAKRCKEKWENINKYFKKVKESNKKRHEDSKTCPYFHQLDALYKKKHKHDSSSASNQLFNKPGSSDQVPLMVQPEQQWPLQQHDEEMEEVESDQNVEDGDDDDDDEEEEEDDGGGFEIVPNKQVNSMDANE